MTQPARYNCWRCAMSFRIEERSGGAKGAVCPDCWMRFWHAGTAGTVGRGGGRVVVGIDPADYPP